jgi:hypothetical protein
MMKRIKLNIVKWWYSYQLKQLSEITADNLELWITFISTLSTKVFNIPPGLRLEVQANGFNEYYRAVNKISKYLISPIDMPPIHLRNMLLEDWLVDRDVFPITINTALEDFAILLKAINLAYTNTEDTDFAASVMSQYSGLFITVATITTVGTRHIVG